MIRTYGPSSQTVTPADDTEVEVLDRAGAPVDLDTPVSVDEDGKVSFTVDDATAPSDVYVKVTSADSGATSTDRWHLGEDDPAEDLRSQVAAGVGAVNTAITGWAGLDQTGKNAATLSALQVLSDLAALAAVDAD